MTDGTNPTTQEELAEPLLPQGDDVESIPPEDVCATTDNDDNNNDDTGDGDSNTEFSFQNEVAEMVNLGIPLAVSFFCRMGMASTDSAFVGHIHNGDNSPEVYLAAAVLSDMMVTLCITPPLAFNQIVSALVGQAMGSNNPKMAGIWLQQSMFWIAVTMTPCLVGLFYVQPCLELLGFSQEISEVAGQYAKWNLLWPVPNGLYQCLRFYFQACGFPRPAMYNNLAFLGINALLNWIFVFGGPIPGWNGFGFIGAAISLSISRTMQGVCYFIYMFLIKEHHKHAWPD
ncbi:Probable multidrug resistance protein NorM (Partial), partial [Seminavis robusta]|eukprot:Sro2935_g340590.1 Probable multidrug resistance protein NorM (285) ;mRNA; f:9134-10254